MKLSFTKMNGAGNDFVMIDNRSDSIVLSQAQIAQLCHRHRGVGADGVILLEKEPTSEKNTTPYRMRYYNADGREVEMCGNGARCFTFFLHRLLCIPEAQTTEASPTTSSSSHRFMTFAGVISGDCEPQSLHQAEITLTMSHPFDLQLGIKASQLLKELPNEEEKNHFPSLLEKITPHHFPSYSKELAQKQEIFFHRINTGVPHLLLFIENLHEAPLQELGRFLRYHPHFNPPGINVNLVAINIAPKATSQLEIRTYERGVEAETLACGTGVVAAALLYHLLTETSAPISVKVQGEEILQVAFSSKNEYTSKDFTSLEKTAFQEVTLKGPAEVTFEGSFQL